MGQTNLMCLMNLPTCLISKNWTSKAVPLSQAFAVLSDMMDDENNTTNKKFDA